MSAGLPLVRTELAAVGGAVLDKRVVLVTGASGGLGRECALACARAGAVVVLAGRKVRALEAVYDEIEAIGAATAAIYPINLEGATPDDYATLADAIRLQCGRLDGIVHTAAHFDGLRPLEQTKPLDWMRTLHVDLTAAFLLTQACMPLLGEREDSSVILIDDDAARIGKAYWGAYGVAKAGLAAYASILAHECEDGPVRVHGVLPAPMRTGLRRMAYFGEDTMTRDTPQATARAIVFLLGREAAALRGKTLDLRPESARH